MICFEIPVDLRVNRMIYHKNSRAKKMFLSSFTIIAVSAMK